MSSRISIRTIIKHLLLIASGLIVMIWTVYLIVSPTKFALGVILFLITFIVGELLLTRNGSKPIIKKLNSFHNGNQHFSGDFVAIALAVSSILIGLIPPIEGELYVPWLALALLSALRLVAAFSLNFLPGYLILSIIGGRARLQGLSKLVASYFLSLFVITIVGFLCAYQRGIIDGFYLTTFLIVNVALLVVYFFYRLQKRASPISSDASFSVRGFRLLLPAVLLVLTIAFKYIWLFGSLEKVGFFIGGQGSDMWRHHGFAQSFLDGRAFVWLYLPWWFHVYLASFTVISGVPSVNAYLALYPLMIISPLSFYVMVSSFFKDKRVAVLATLAFTAFSGPGGLYALYLRDFGPITDYTSWIRIIWQTGEKFLLEGWYPPFAIGFVPSDIAYACLWWMVYATHRLELQNRFNFILMSIVLALSYLLHGVDLVIFIIYLGALLLVHLCTQNQEGKKRVRWVAFSVIAALALVAAIEVSLTKYYYFAQYTRTLYDFPRYFYFNTSHFYVAVATSTIIITLTYAKPAAQNFMSKLISWMTKPIILMVCFLYVLSLAIWVRALPSFNSGLIGVGPVPWYAYSATGGIPFFLALIGATYLALNWKRLKNNVRDALVFSVLSMALLFIFGRIVSLVNLNFFYTGFWERRILVYMRPMISILAAYALVIVFTRINVKKPFDWLKFIMTSFLISLVILSSVSTALIALDFTAREGVSAPTKEELEALTYLRYSLPKGFKTAYLNRYTGIYFIRGFANDKWTFDPKLWIGHFPYSPETILYVIGEGNLRLLYLHHTRDIRDLQKNLFLQQLLNMLPVEFNNSDVTIYSVPPLHPPLSFSSLGVIPPDETYGASYDAYILWLLTLAVSNYSYTISDFSDPTIFVGSQVFILPYDPPPFGDDVAKLLEWVTNGGHLIVSNTNAYGTFAELFGLTSKVSLVSCDSTDNWKTSYDRGEILFETAEKIEGASSLRMRNNSSAWEEWVYTTQEPWDLSEYEYLGIWVYGTGGGPKWYLHLFDSNGRRSFPSYRYDLSRWDSEKQTYVPNFSGWKLHLIPIKEYFSDIDLSNIKELRVVTGFEMPVDMIIDDIFALRGYPYVTANGIGSKETINLPIVMVQNISFSAEVRVVANYTKDGTPVAAFAIQKDLGEGRVTYLNINLLYESILSEGAEPVSTEMFVKILEMIDIKVPP